MKTLIVVMVAAGCGWLCGAGLRQGVMERGAGKDTSQGRPVRAVHAESAGMVDWETIDVAGVGHGGYETTTAFYRLKMRALGEERSVALLLSQTAGQKKLAALALALEYPDRAQKEYGPLVVSQPDIRIWLLRGLAESRPELVMDAMEADHGPGGATAFFCLSSVLETDPAAALAWLGKEGNNQFAGTPRMLSEWIRSRPDQFAEALRSGTLAQSGLGIGLIHDAVCGGAANQQEPWRWDAVTASMPREPEELKAWLASLKKMTMDHPGMTTDHADLYRHVCQSLARTGSTPDDAPAELRVDAALHALEQGGAGLDTLARLGSGPLEKDQADRLAQYCYSLSAEDTASLLATPGFSREAAREVIRAVAGMKGDGLKLLLERAAGAGAAADQAGQLPLICAAALDRMPLEQSAALLASRTGLKLDAVFPTAAAWRDAGLTAAQALTVAQGAAGLLHDAATWTSGAVTDWLAQNSVAASEGVRNMPPGSNRDAGIAAVVAYCVSHGDRGSAGAWAALITDPAMRASAAQRLQ